MVQLSGRPLLDNQLDADLVVGRDALVSRVADVVADDLNVLLVGERGSGRTTALRQVARNLRQRDLEARWIDAGTALTTGELIDLVTTRVAGQAGWNGLAADAWPLQRLLSTDADALPRVVLLDNVVATAGYGLFGTLRDELWQLPMRWAVTCTDRERATLVRPPADAFFDVVMTLQPLGDDQARALVRARVPDGQLSDLAVEKVVDIAGGNPRALLAAARALLDDPIHPAPPEKLAEASRQRGHLLSTVSPAASRLLADMEASGPASASDPVLLARHGWTRSRASQLLRELHAAGLVEATRVRRGPGRPRTVYSAVTVRA